MNKYTIVIDTLGSDKGPEAILEGARIVLEENPNVSLTLVGDEEVIKAKGLPNDRIKIIHAPETVTNYDNPIEAFPHNDRNNDMYPTPENLKQNKEPYK